MSDEEQAFLSYLDVSRETLNRLGVYAELIRKWNKTINLVANSTIDDLWKRHFLDSAAVFQAAAPTEGTWVDLGSGGGFPGAVVAILAAEKRPDVTITCIEADVRKAAFLRTLSAETKVKFSVLSRRVEDTPPQKCRYLSARALSPLKVLLSHAERHLGAGGIAVFPKGENWRQEVEDALETYRFSVENKPSPTHPGSAILVVGDITRA